MVQDEVELTIAHIAALARARGLELDEDECVQLLPGWRTLQQLARALESDE